jgi:hypothetical protein
MRFLRIVMKTGVALIFITTVQATLSFGQDARLKIDALAGLSDKASQTIDVTVDEGMIRLASKFLSSQRSPDEARAKEIIAGLKGVYVKSFEFDAAGGYSQQDLDSVKSQLKNPAWSRVVGVICKRKGEKQDIEVYLMSNGDQIQGLAAIASDEKNLTVVNVVGVIDVEKLSSLCGKFGIPQWDISLNPK